MRNKLIELINPILLKYRFDAFENSDKIADHLMGSRFIEELQNEAYDLGADSVLHYKLGLSWDDADDLRKEIKRLQDAERWIPVGERLPEEYEGWSDTTSDSVLVAFKRYDGSVGITTSFTLGGKWATAVDVTHWMPLPEAPKEEKDD